MYGSIHDKNGPNVEKVIEKKEKSIPAVLSSQLFVECILFCSLILSFFILLTTPTPQSTIFTSNFIGGPKPNSSTHSHPARPRTTDDNDDETGNLSMTVQASEETSSIFRFTTKRSGYQSLQYFRSNYDKKHFRYNILSQFDGIIEPFINMKFDFKDNNDSSSNTFLFTICKEDSPSDCIIEDKSFTFEDSTQQSFTSTCTPHDKYTVTTTEYSSSNEIVSTTSGKLICMYVRREIQSLTEKDLTRLMDAMYTLWSTPEEEGQALYSSDFHNSTFFVHSHDFNAAQQDADHIHEGLGFLTQHLKITNLFEKAVQAVDPSVALPYWDYTLEVAQGKALNESIMFSEDTFGSLAFPSSRYWGFRYNTDDILDGRIPDGRWKDLKAEMNSKFPDLRSPYGYLRGPWNMNPSPYISRFATGDTPLPSCSQTYSFLGDNLNMTDFFYQSSFGPHAGTHGAIGSAFGCDSLIPLLGAGLISSQKSLLSLCRKWVFIMKELYRANLISLDSQTCETEEGSLFAGGFSCQFQCADDLSMVSGLKSHIHSYVPTLSSSQWDDWKDFVCGGNGYRIFAGDHLESASPADPSFWSIHPTLERLLHAKQMTGGFPDTTWPSDFLTESVCDKKSCYEDGVKVYSESCCDGHFEHSQLLDFVNGNRSGGYGQTNGEIFRASDASSDSYSVPYVYAEFQWDHCDESSEDINGLFEYWAGI